MLHESLHLKMRKHEGALLMCIALDEQQAEGRMLTFVGRVRATQRTAVGGDTSRGMKNIIVAQRNV